jgi:ectoine hydroxylase-related dioxygenase (phytanoyl-CoA dioxygenase family)
VAPVDERAFFAAHGWLVIRSAVSGARVAELARSVDELFAASPPTRDGELWEVAGVSRGSPDIARHTHDPNIARYAAAALGCARVQLLQDTVLVKPRAEAEYPDKRGEVGWHQDHTYTGYLQPRLLSVRLALTECTTLNGCLEVIDSSHEWGLLGSVRALSEPSVADALGDGAANWAERIMPLELAPGDLSLHHCFTFHRSGTNRSAHARKTLITRMFDADCTLLREHLPPAAAAHFPVDEAGHLSVAAFPILWPAT